MPNPSHRHPRYLLRDQLDTLREDARRSHDAARGPGIYAPRTLSKVLVPLDGSILSERILTVVRWIVARRDVEVMLLYVMTEGDAAVAREGQVESSCDYLEAHRMMLIESGATSVRYDIMVGDPAERILTFAEGYRPSLIAMATHGRSGLSRLVRGSVTETLLRRSPFPVLASNPLGLDMSERPQLLHFRSILVPLDLSETSAAIIPLVGEVAALYGSSVTLLHAIEPLGLPVEQLVGFEMTPREAEELLAPYVDPLSVSGISVRVRTSFGPAAPSILDVVNEEQFDLVAMTTHGRSGLSRLVYGSVTEQVLRGCPCPLLLQRTARSPAPATALPEDAAAGARTS